jgi:hypothetical protein
VTVTTTSFTGRKDMTRRHMLGAALAVADQRVLPYPPPSPIGARRYCGGRSEASARVTRMKG